MKYPLFDRTREKKSIRLVRKLQQEADSEWEKELATRKKQEAMDEAMAKELQAKEEQEERKRQNQSNAFNPFLSQGSFDSIEAKDHLNASTQYPTKQYKPHLITNLLCRSPSPILDKHTEPMMPLNTVVQPSNETLSTKTYMPIQTNVQPNANQSPTKPPLPIRKASIIKDSLATKKSDQKRQSSSVPSPTKYSDSFLLLKPDEKEHTAFVAIPVTERTDQMKTTNTKPTLQILDPTADLIKCQSKGKEKVEPYRVYEEKESQEDEHRLGHTSPYQPHILYPYSFSTPILANSSFAQDNQHPVNRVYPTNFLKAGAPPLLIHGPSSSRAYTNSSLPEHSKQNKSAYNKTPKDTERHITVTSIYPGQRSWIKIYPTDTGKILAERISILASYRTRRVTKIITKSGTEIALNDSLLFDDWNDILNFKDGEPWRVEWVPLERSFENTARQGKDMVKQLKNIVSKPQACT